MPSCSFCIRLRTLSLPSMVPIRKFFPTSRRNEIAFMAEYQFMLLTSTACEKDDDDVDAAEEEDGREESCAKSNTLAKHFWIPLIFSVTSSSLSRVLSVARPLGSPIRAVAPPIYSNPTTNSHVVLYQIR